MDDVKDVEPDIADQMISLMDRLVLREMQRALNEEEAPLCSACRESLNLPAMTPQERSKAIEKGQAWIASRRKVAPPKQEDAPGIENYKKELARREAAEDAKVAPPPLPVIDGVAPPPPRGIGRPSNEQRAAEEAYENAVKAKAAREAGRDDSELKARLAAVGFGE